MSARFIGRVASCLLAATMSISGAPMVWQEPGDPRPVDDEKLHALLVSSDPTDWAWAAWLARRDRRGDMISIAS